MFSISHFLSKLFWFMLFVLLSIIIAIFVGSNTQLITLSFWPIPGQITIIIWLAVLLAFTTGLVIGALIIWLNSILYYRAQNQKLKKKLKNSHHKEKKETDSYLEFDQTDRGSYSDNLKVKQK